MKTYFNIFSLILLILSAIALKAQNDYTITKQSISDDFLGLIIENQNGKYVEYFINADYDGVEAGVFQASQLNLGQTEGIPDYFIKNINLPSDEYSSIPLQFFNSGSKIFLAGTKEILVINPETGKINNTIPLSNSGSYTTMNYLSTTPVNRFLAGSLDNQLLYCVDLINNLYIIDMDSETVIFSDSYIDYPDQISTAVGLNETYGYVYWLINSWQGTEGTVIRIHDAIDGDFITQRVFDNQINDILVCNDTLYVSTPSGLLKLNPHNLQTLNSYAGSYEKLFPLGDLEFAASRYYMQHPNNRRFVVFNAITCVPNQEIVFQTGAISIYDVIVTDASQSIVVLNLATDGNTDLFYLKKDLNNQYYLAGNDWIMNVYARGLAQSTDGNTVYFGGKDYLGQFNLTSFQIEDDFTIKGCYSYSLMLNNYDSIDYVYSANPIEGTFSRHYDDCSIDVVVQTAFKTSNGCLNNAGDKLYIVNNRINYESSGLAIIDLESDELKTILQLGTYLTESVFNENSNKLFVASKGDSQVKVICGDSDSQIDQITLPIPPLKLFSYGNKILCGANSAIFVIDANSHSFSTIYLPFSNTVEEKCRDFEAIPEFNYLCALYAHGNKTYVVEIDNSSFTLNQIHEMDYYRGEVIKYNPTDERIYIANSLIPKLYIYRPEDFREIDNVPYLGQALLYDLQMSIDKYRNKAYLTYFNFAQRKHYLTVINCENLDFTTSDLNTAKSAHAFNPINEQVYYLDVALNQNNRNETVASIKDCMDDSNFSDLTMENLHNRSVSLLRANERITPIVYSHGNKIYFPNGDFSNVSVINGYTDVVALQSGWNWKSFPRMERYNNNPHPTSPVLERISEFPTTVYMIYPYPANNYIQYDLYTWSGPLTEIKSTYGYKLNLQQLQNPNPYIVLHGAKLHPSTQITLSPVLENWIGYFIEEGQWPWDAFPQDLLDNYLTSITSQYWSMVKIGGVWFSTHNIRPIEYADMVIVTISGNNPVSFEWNLPEEEAESEERMLTEYFQFQEQDSYLPVYVEIDPDEGIKEIALVADNVYRGATVVPENDTLVQICAYVNNLPPGIPLEFETWSGTKTRRFQNNGYVVKNQKTGTYELRTIYSGENKSYQFISLKTSTVPDVEDEVCNIIFSPNPFIFESTVQFNLKNESSVKLIIYDILGNVVAIPVKGTFQEGTYKTQWFGNDASGNVLPPGFYTYRFIVNDRVLKCDKIIIAR
jgi:hypothetical protein